MGFLRRTSVKASQIMEEAISFLIGKYEQASQVFTPASPFGQLLTVIANISELVFTYIAHTAEEMNIYTAQNIETIHGLANLAGHDAFRGGSAYGVMKIKLNDSASDYIRGNYAVIENFTKFVISETGETYFLNLQGDRIKLNLEDRDPVAVYFMQGDIETQTFTSDGTPLQSFNPIVKGMTDHYNVSVSVNGKEWKRVESLYDMPADDGEEGCECFILRSSVNVGLSVFFGNGQFGKIPPQGSTIDITYIKTTGSSGNANVKSLTYVFKDSAYDEYGNELDLNDILQVDTVSPPMLGCNYEDPEFTKLIAPKASKSFVLATPENYMSYLSKYNQYAYIYAYNTKEDDDIEDDNAIYIKVLPDIKKKLSSNVDYFSLPENEFYLSDIEINALKQVIEDSGRMLVGSEVVIQRVEVKRFAINVFVKYFEGSDKNTIRTDIRNAFNKYFININRKDIIPLSDLIGIVEKIDGVDTCSVFFITEDNENAVRYHYNHITDEDLEFDEDPHIHLDEFGNIIVDPRYTFIPKGGWYDRSNNYFTETPETGKLGPLNIFFTEEIDADAYNINMQKKFNNLLNS